MQEIKRKPLLVDEIVYQEFVGPNPKERRRWDVVREHLREAKKFVLDEKAAIYAAEMIRDHPLAIAHDQEFAIPPFPATYIEVPYAEFFIKLGGSYDDLEGDTDVGYFIDGPTAYIMSRARWDSNTVKALFAGSNNRAIMLPLAFRLNQPFTVQEELDAATLLGTSRMGLDQLYWGSITPQVSKHPEMFRALRANHSFEIWYGHDVPNVMPVLYKSMHGDLRNVIALILFLNRTSDLRIEQEIGPKQGFIRNHVRIYQRHSVIRLRLDPKPMLKKVYGHGGVWRREHDCRGHFCHDKLAHDSPHHPKTHDWHEYGVNIWRCMICGGRKWWRKAHKRGHREKGLVTTSYEVTK
jgi:hypothetical protein